MWLKGFQEARGVGGRWKCKGENSRTLVATMQKIIDNLPAFGHPAFFRVKRIIIGSQLNPTHVERKS